jgi:hypothetical protein
VYAIFTNAQLAAVAQAQPASQTALQEIDGLGLWVDAGGGEAAEVADDGAVVRAGHHLGDAPGDADDEQPIGRAGERVLERR